jgi:hypothetical protein
VALFGAATVVLASSILLAAAHANDRFQVGWVQGTRMALARSANEGDLFPPLYDGAAFGGTRFMPLPIVLHAGFARVTDEYLLSGKQASYLSTALLLGGVFVSLRQRGTRRVVAFALATAVLATRPGFLAATTIQGDALPVFWQVAALGVVNRSTGRISVVTSSALCVLAFLSKLSALWAPAAIVLWLGLRAPRRLWLFLGSFIGLLGVTIALLQWITDGRMLENLMALALSGASGPAAVVRAPLRALALIADSGPVAVVLVPIAIIGTLRAAKNGGITIAHVALPLAFLLLVAITADEGTLTNHVLDVVVLTTLVVGILACDSPRVAVGSWVAGIVGVSLVWGSVLFAVTDLEQPVVGSVRALVNGSETDRPVRPLGGIVDANDSILSEDPYVPVALGQRPVVLDAWALLRLGHRHPDWVAELSGRIEEGEFDRIILVNSIDFRSWYSSSHLGPEVAAAIRNSYQLVGVREGYYVYAPHER